MKLLLVTAAVLAVASWVNIPLEDLEFHAWKLKFGKSYNSPSEEANRKQIWIRNRKLVLVHNMMADEGITSYRLGMTYFADMENEEYKRLVFHGCLRSSNTSRHGFKFFHLFKSNDLPESVDWRDKGYVTDVKEEKECGTSWAFSATGSLEGQNFRKTGKLVSLSERQLVDCLGKYGNEGCNGRLMDQAFEYIQANGGIDTEESYPCDAEDGPCCYNPAYIGATCSGYVDVDAGDEDALKAAVAIIGPVSVAIDASNFSFQFYESGVYDEPECSSSFLDHDVLAVGYGSEDGKDYWLVKNSWGLSWGENGYIKMSRSEGNQCGIATAASYPLV
ncbi:procathepsin L-like isoform 1-T3 [Pholidichthys leucotaenia]